MTFKELPEDSVLAVGAVPAQDIYNLSAVTALGAAEGAGLTAACFYVCIRIWMRLLAASSTSLRSSTPDLPRTD